MLETNNTVLVVIDFQGKLADIIANRDVVINNTQLIIKAAQTLNIPILLTEEAPEKIGVTQSCIKDLIPDVHAIAKTAFSCVGEPNFKDQLSLLKRKQVLITGIETHVCVHQTVVDLVANGYDVHVLADAVSSRDVNNKEIGLKRIAQEGGKISCVEMAICELLRCSTHEKFKDVMGLVK